MFERFSEQARAVVVEAVSVAEVHGSPRVGREHLIVALAVRGEPTLLAVSPDAAAAMTARLAQRSPLEQDRADADALSAIGIDLAAIRDRVAAQFGPDAWAEGTPRRRGVGLLARLLPEHRPFTSGARKSLELALREAIAQGSREITATHLLRGILRDPGPEARAVVSPELAEQLRERLGRGDVTR